MSNIIKSLLALIWLSISSNSYAHIGHHNELFHSQSGADHLLITLAISLFSVLVIYLFRK